MPPRDRIAYWREEAGKVFVRNEFTSSVGSNFQGEISAASLGTVGLAAMAGDPCNIDRTARHLGGATDDDIILCRQISGNVTVHQDGRDAATGPGDAYVLDRRRPFALGLVSHTQGVFFKIPRSDLQARLGDIANYAATPFRRGDPTASLASEFLLMLARRANDSTSL